MATPESTFHGFSKEGLAFFHELSLRQDREWFKERKADYQRLWEAPMHALFEALKARLQKRFKAVTKNEPRHFRIYRDTRFSKDKTPFKTSVSAALALYRGEAMTVSGVYCEFGIETFVGVGRYMMEPPQLARFRQAVAGKTGDTFAKQLAQARVAGIEPIAHDTLKRVPKPFVADHPRGELLKLKGFALSFPPPPLDVQRSTKLVGWVAERVEKAAPMLEWLEQSVG